MAMEPDLIISAYTTAIGFVGKVNLRSGRFAWTHEGLYRDGNFTAFELPQSDNENVLFKETTIYSRPVKTIVVDKKNGRIVQIR